MSRESRVLLVTGGSRGIGRAVCEQAARRGYQVCFTYREARQKADAIVHTIEQDGGQAMAVRCDLADEAQILQIFERLDATWGAPDVLINNAAVVDLQATVATMTRERLERMFGINVIGSFLTAREAIRRMSTKHGGRGGVIVNVSSIAARLGSPGEYVDYAASKAAIDAFTLGLAKEVADEGIRVNAVRPGLTETDIHKDSGEPGRAERLRPTVPLKRVGQPEEIAEAILWLASEASSYCTGTLLDVSGGR